jgi:hypothetical protein
MWSSWRVTKIWKEKDMICFKALSCYSPEETESNHKNIQRRTELDTFKILF